MISAVTWENPPRWTAPPNVNATNSRTRNLLPGRMSSNATMLTMLTMLTVAATQGCDRLLLRYQHDLEDRFEQGSGQQGKQKRLGDNFRILHPNTLHAKLLT